MVDDRREWIERAGAHLVSLGFAEGEARRVAARLRRAAREEYGGLWFPEPEEAAEEAAAGRQQEGENRGSNEEE
jgi:hypothetical protein